MIKILTNLIELLKSIRDCILKKKPKINVNESTSTKPIKL